MTTFLSRKSDLEKEVSDGHLKNAVGKFNGALGNLNSSLEKGHAVDRRLLNAIKNSTSKFKSDNSSAAARRISMIDGLAYVESNFGWDFHSATSLDVLDFLYGLHQAGVDGDLQFFGKPNRNIFENLTRNERLVAIAAEHWRDFELDIWKAQSENDNFYVWSINKRTSDIKSGGYADVYVDRRRFVSWLETANIYKGHTKRPQ